jgi:nucleoside-diphosphate-sugar epimerase
MAPMCAPAGGESEEDPLDPTPAREMRETLAAIRHLEEAVLDARWTEGIVLRYGAFYGPGTSMAPDGEQSELVRRRKFPLVGDGGGVWSFIHVADAAEATVAAVEHGSRGIYNVVDDDPARSPSGCRRWRRRWAPRTRRACRVSSDGCSPGRPAW